MLAGVAPAVVNIATEGEALVAPNPLLNDPFFRRFFGLQGPPEEARPQRTEGLGSGVIIDAANGYVLTNAHVIERADRIAATLTDGRQYDAEIIGTDAETDIALIQIPANGLVELALADSDTLRVGDFIVAIGNPFGLGQTVTSGIVSALGRSGLGIKGYEDFIQTDASVNPGSSGGALVDLRGQLVGINTAILAPNGGNVGISFAIPINMVKPLIKQLLRFGRVERGRLGVAVSNGRGGAGVNTRTEALFGALITQVLPDSAAAHAGLRSGDLITTINGKLVASAAALRNAIGLLRVGDRLAIGLQRDGKPLTLNAQVGER